MVGRATLEGTSSMSALWVDQCSKLDQASEPDASVSGLPETDDGFHQDRHGHGWFESVVPELGDWHFPVCHPPERDFVDAVAPGFGYWSKGGLVYAATSPQGF